MTTTRTTRTRGTKAATGTKSAATKPADGTPGPEALAKAVNANPRRTRGTRRTAGQPDLKVVKDADAAQAEADQAAKSKTSPQADGENSAEPKGKDYAYVLTSEDSHFEVHKPGCADLKKIRTDYPQPGVGTASTYVELVRDLWDDQIAERKEPEEEKTDEWVLKNFDVDIHVAPCIRFTGKPKVTKPKAERASAKRELATKVVEAAAGMVFEHAVHNGIPQEEAAKIVAHWLHHLPADRERWVASGLPKPNRSDWQ